jgi:hypothetical protein
MKDIPITMKAVKVGLCQSVVLVFFCLMTASWGQTTFEPIRVTFDGPPVQPPGTAFTVQRYYEAGMAFTPIDPNAPWAGFGRVGRNPVPGRPDDGTAYLQAALGDSLKFSFSNGSLLNLVAVDLGEYSTVFQAPKTVHFVGYRYDGSVITTDLTTDGIIDGTGPLTDFETFHFGPEWNGLTRVEIPTFGWSLDNLVVVIPEPSSGTLLLAGGAGPGIVTGSDSSMRIAGCPATRLRKRCLSKPLT